MKIAIGADHRGFAHKEYIKQALADIEWVDVGAYNDERSDYPVFARKAVQAMQAKRVDCGILLCGTGVGMAVVANRYNKIYAALVWNEEIASQSKSHDNANILVLPSDYISPDQAVNMIREWLATEFLAGRYAERINMIDKNQRH